MFIQDLAIHLLINLTAKEYNVNKRLMTCIVREESTFQPNARNPHSSATGLAQFIEGTWIAWRKERGKDPSLHLRTNPQEAIDMLGWAFSKGRHHHWVTYSECK